jgi:hypothetical protein
MNYAYGYLILSAVSALCLFVLMRHETKHYPVDKVCPKCPPEEERRHNYLTHGGICQECAWKDLADKMKDGYN